MEKGGKMSNIKDKTLGGFQKLGKAILLPIAILPVAGLFLGIASALSSKAAIVTYPFLDNTILQGILKIMNSVGAGVFNALPLIFAVGIAVGLAKKDKGVAGLAAVVGYFSLIVTINAILSITGQLAGLDVDPKSVGQGLQYGIMTLQMGVFGGMLAGIFTSIVHNKYYNLKLPEVLAFFGGSRSVPIITSFVGVFFGIIMFFVWPLIGDLIVYFGSFVTKLGVLGGFLYGILLRTFYLFGLHHVFYLPFWTTAAGGTLEIAGQGYEGFQNIFLAQLSDPDTVKFFRNIALFNSGRYFHFMFTLPAACLAMYKAIPDLGKRKKTYGFLLSIALTSFITGVSEPISYALLFANPLLFVLEALLFAINFLIAGILNITIGSTFSAGLVEFLLFGVFQGQAKTGYLTLLATGIPMAIVSYYMFYFTIKKLDAKTPGRENELEEVEIKGEYDKLKVDKILLGLGKLENIVELDNCATRLRVIVKNEKIINKKLLKETGALNVLIRGTNIQIIYGPTVNMIKNDIEDYISDLNLS